MAGRARWPYRRQTVGSVSTRLDSGDGRWEVSDSYGLRRDNHRITATDSANSRPPNDASTSRVRSADTCVRHGSLWSDMALWFVEGHGSLWADCGSVICRVT